MNRTRSYIAVTIFLSLFVVLCLAGCSDDPPQDIDISQITIINIPATFKVGRCINVRVCFLPDPNRTKEERDALLSECDKNCRTITEEWEPFKIYLNASNSMSPSDAPTAKGMAFISDATLQSNGKYTVTMQLQKPNPGLLTDPDFYQNPCLPTGSWSGTSAFFSIMISPAFTFEHGVNSIWAKAGFTLNIGKSTIDWDLPQKDGGLVDSRTSSLMNDSQIKALYDIVLSDDCCIDLPALP